MKEEEVEQVIDEAAQSQEMQWREELGMPVEELDKSLWPDYVHRAHKVESMAEDIPSDCDRCLEQAIEEQIWPEGVNKAPSWQDDDDVTTQTQEWVDAVFELRDPLYGDYSDIPQAAGLSVKRIIKDSLVQEQGWSLDSVITNLSDEFEWLSEGQAKTIARQEIAAVLNHAELLSLKARPDEPTVRWVGPEDRDTTELCSEVKDEVGDGVPVSELEAILAEKAREYDYGTPERVDQLVPHFLCRHKVSLVE